MFAMKTTLISLLSALLLGSAALASGRLLDAADFIAILFTSGLVAWTAAQYRTIPRLMHTTGCHHLPIKAVAARPRSSGLARQAA